ncbi:MAG TPA: SUF system Fe-S cluster assembly protein [Saprospiraceae bacterium]|nr:SUF system Fe-S cluster assembly protein [Saprospiraceae bacterium]
MTIKEKVMEVLKTIYDPEIPVDIWELGLVYGLDVDDAGKVMVRMTLTSPACPVAESLPVEVYQRVMETEGVTDVDLQVVWDPPWNKERMSDEARLVLNMF